MLTKDESHFIMVTSDKAIKAFNCESLELTAEIQPAHSMSINDCYMLSDTSILSASSDRTVKLYNIEGSKFGLAKEFALNENDAAAYKEAWLKQ